MMLIWRVSRVESDNLRSPSRYRSPSWSWASVDTQVVYNFVDRELFPVIDVIDCHIDHLSSDPFSQVTGGWIRVCGTLHPALLYRSDGYTWDLKYTLVLPQTGMQLYAMPDAESGDSAFSRRAAGNPIIKDGRSSQMDKMLDSFKEGGKFVFLVREVTVLVARCQRRVLNTMVCVSVTDTSHSFSEHDVPYYTCCIYAGGGPALT